LAVTMYSDENNGAVHYAKSSSGDPGIPNGGMWTPNPQTDVLINPDDLGNAYWGVAYVNYIGGKGSRPVFRCPSAKHVDEWHDAGLYPPTWPAEFWMNSTYGTQQYLVSPYRLRDGPRLKISELNYPGSTIFCQDAAEQKMEGDDDSLGPFPNKTRILEQWIGNPPGSGGLSLLYNHYPFQWEW